MIDSESFEYQYLATYAPDADDLLFTDAIRLAQARDAQYADELQASVEEADPALPEPEIDLAQANLLHEPRYNLRAALEHIKNLAGATAIGADQATMNRTLTVIYQYCEYLLD